MARKRLLVAYSMHSTFVPTTLEYLRALKAYSEFDVSYVHVTHDALMNFDFADFDAVFHNYCARLCFDGYVSGDYLRQLRAFRGPKILAVQDEYDHTEKLRAAIVDLGFDVVLTCVPQDSLDYVYPRARLGHVQFETVLTGYAPAPDPNNTPTPLAQRPIVLGYRGRDIGGRYGRLGHDKYRIGVEMKRIAAEAGIVADIAVDEDSRIYGAAWPAFVGNCRAMLGSESGSNVFDFDGALSARYKEMAAANGGAVSYEDFAPIIAERDNEIEMGQISPRVFECAAARTAMVLFRGRYSDAIAPDLHYIALEKDFSNATDVIARLSDLPALEAMTARAYDHLIASGQFAYQAFCQRIDALIMATAAAKPATSIAPTPAAAVDALAQRHRAETPTAVPLAGAAVAARKSTSMADVLTVEVSRLKNVYQDLITQIGREQARASEAFALTHNWPAPQDHHAAILFDKARNALAPNATARLIAAAAAAQSDYLRVLEPLRHAQAANAAEQVVTPALSWAEVIAIENRLESLPADTSDPATRNERIRLEAQLFGAFRPTAAAAVKDIEAHAGARVKAMLAEYDALNKAYAENYAAASAFLVLAERKRLNTVIVGEAATMRAETQRLSEIWRRDKVRDANGAVDAPRGALDAAIAAARAAFGPAETEIWRTAATSPATVATDDAFRLIYTYVEPHVAAQNETLIAMNQAYSQFIREVTQRIAEPQSKVADSAPQLSADDPIAPAQPPVLVNWVRRGRGFAKRVLTRLRGAG